MIWSPQQDAALIAVRDWYRSPTRSPVFHLFGYAGTGKTTLAIEIAKMVNGMCMFAAFTGKASLVMARKGCTGARTIHSLIYKVEEDPSTGEMKFRLNHSSDLARASLLIIDECSMVGEEIGTDLLSFKVPILVLGDPAQLPPVEGAGFFTDFSTPEIMLTEIHRQAEGNPIIRIATAIRTGGKIEYGNFKSENGAASIVRSRDLRDSSLLAADQVICGTNKKRQHLNRQMRAWLRQDGKLPLTFNNDEKNSHLPVIGDRIICLRNRHDRSMYNGSLWNITKITDRTFGGKKRGLPNVSYLRVESADEPGVKSYCDVRHEYWQGPEAVARLEPRDKRGYDEFDYGYAITCHKSQGSQWDKVLIFDEGYVFREDAARWSYTAVTRAAEKLILVRD
jgi:exodeoxyribonuclease-5